MSKTKIGIITKPQALKGAIRLKPTLLNLKLYKTIESVTIDDVDYLVESVCQRESFLILKLKGIDSCEQAEALRNKEVFAFVDTKTETHYDILNYSVLLDGEILGIVESIENFGATDILSVESKVSFIMLPVIEGLIGKIDDEQKTVELNKDIFEQVAVYEN